MKYSQWLGIIAAIALIVSCFLPWTFHPDLNKYFTGFFSEGNIYGKPGKVITLFSSIAVVFFLIPKIWAKRWNLLVAAIISAWAIRNFIVFTGCYRGICPEKQPAVWVMLISSLLILVAAIIPDIKLKDNANSGK